MTAKTPTARIAIEEDEGKHRPSQVPQQTTQQPRGARQTIPQKVYPKRIRRDISERRKYQKRLYIIKKKTLLLNSKIFH